MLEYLGLIYWLYWGYIGVYRGYIGGSIGIMEKNMETTIWGLGRKGRRRALGFEGSQAQDLGIQGFRT